MCLSIMLNQKLHIKIEVLLLNGMWYETYFTIPISIFQSIIQKEKGISTSQSS